MLHEVSLSYFVRFFNIPQIVGHGADGFSSPHKEGVLRIFIALKNLLPSTGFEPSNLGSNSKHSNHQTTEYKHIIIIIIIIITDY
jgi:hypothetical protein